MKMVAFWDVVPCSLIKFTDVSVVPTRGIPASGLLITLMMEVARTSETLVNFY
jgi:hypothetical protein